jgi:hypothetical protein
MQLHTGIIVLGTKGNKKEFRNALPEESSEFVREELNAGLVAESAAGEKEARRRSGGGGRGGHGAWLAGELWRGEGGRGGEDGEVFDEGWW